MPKNKIVVDNDTNDMVYMDMQRNNKGQYIKINPNERFWDKVEKTDYCWNWKGNKRKDGYGVIAINGKGIRVHRFVLGINDPNIKIIHICDNPMCVNPSHLITGSQTENMKDMFNKNRNSKYFSPGTKNPRAKLSKKQIKEIRKKYIPIKYSGYKLAKEYGVAQQTISKIINYKRYVQE